MTDYDIAICGAGPVGLALAALLVKGGVNARRVALFDGKTLAAAIKDPRTIALSYGSRQVLERCGAWPLPADPIREIHVSRRGHFGRTLLTADEQGLPDLGYVCRYGAVVQKLAQTVEGTALAIQRPVMVSASEEFEDRVELRLDNGLVMSSQLLVQAEGGLFGQQERRRFNRDYGQVAIIAHLHCSRLQAGRAFERFTDEGPLALLPQEGGYSLVWCMTPARAQDLMDLSDAAFLAELQQAFGERVGRFTGISPRHAFPLGLNAEGTQGRRSVAIGNAAQTLHPVAGQGLNLGLRDASELASLLAQSATPEALQAFARERGTDRRLTIRLTDSLARIFASSRAGSPMQHLLGGSLALLDILPPAKRTLAGHMMFGWRP